MRSRSFLRVLAILTIVTTMSLFMGGCYGKFALYQKVRDFNEGIEGKVPKSIVCAVLTIIPIYGFALFFDWIIFNVIEFYSGSNPIVTSASSVTVDGKKAVMSSYEIDGKKEMSISLYEKDVLVKTVVFTNDEGKTTARVIASDQKVIDSADFRDLPSGSVLMSHGDDSRVISSADMDAMMVN